MPHIYNTLLLTIFNSVWQSSLLYGYFLLFVRNNHRLAALQKRNILFVLLTAQVILSLLTIGLASTDIIFPIRYFSNNFEIQHATLAGIILPLYIIGFLGKILMIFIQERNRRGSNRQDKQVLPLCLQKFFEARVSSLKITSKATIWLTKNVQVPLVKGILEPIILLPLCIINNLTHVEIESIIEHELQHIKQHDVLLNYLLVIVETIFFFNPFVFLIAKHIRKERELACDTSVIEENFSPHIYAQALYKVAKPFIVSQFGLAATGHVQNLRERIIYFSNLQKPSHSEKKSYGRYISGVVILIFFSFISLKYFSGAQKIILENTTLIGQGVTSIDFNYKRKETKEINTEASAILVTTDKAFTAREINNALKPTNNKFKNIVSVADRTLSSEVGHTSGLQAVYELATDSTIVLQEEVGQGRKVISAYSIKIIKGVEHKKLLWTFEEKIQQNDRSKIEGDSAGIKPINEMQ